MDKTFRLFASLLTVVYLLPTALLATPIGTAFSYQGQLTNSQGNGTVNGAVHMRFRLFDGPNVATATQVGATLDKCGVDVDKGLFAVTLDFGAVFTGDELYLEMATSADGTCNATTMWSPLAPLQLILATPYAIYALSGPPTSCPAGQVLQAVNGDGTAICVSAGGALSIDPCPAGMAINTINANGTVACISTGITSITGQGGIISQAVGSSINLNTNPSVLQKRITGACSSGQAIQSVNQDGSVNCATIIPSTQASDTGWFTAPMGTDLSLDLGTSTYDFIFGYGRGSSQLTGQVLFPVMGASSRKVIPAYRKLTGNIANVLGIDYLASLQSIGSREDVLLPSGEMRLMAFQRTPSFDSGWQSCTKNVSYVFTHNLGVLPTFAVVEVAQNSDGSGWRLPTMASANHDSLWNQTAIVAMDTTTVTLRTHGRLAEFYTGANQTFIAPTSGYCRVRLFDWTADFDSGWVSFSTTEGDSDKWFQHNLGVVPSLVMLWVSQNAGGGGWILPAMSPYILNYNSGTTIYNISETTVTVKGGRQSVAYFADSGGSIKFPYSGYMRFLAWR